MGKLRHPLAFYSASLWLALGALPVHAAPRQEVPRVPIAFAENQGQFEPEVRFQARLPGLVASVLADGLELEAEGAALRLRFVGAAGAKVEGQEVLSGRAHYLGGGKSLCHVPTFGRVRLGGLYAGIDLELYESDGRLEYDLWFAPEADPAQVVLALEGSEPAEIEPDGALRARLGAGPLRQLAPRAWQVDPEGRATPVVCAWRALGDGCFGFELAPRAADARLVIDPVLVFATHVGGSNADEAASVFIDEGGAVYVTGWARSSDFPTTTPDAQKGTKGKDAVLFKLAPDGHELIYSTTFGGRGDDQGVALRVTRDGRAIVAGTTDSDDFPTTENAFGPRASGGSDGFVVKFSAAGDAFEFATLLGGSAEDTVSDMSLGAGGEITLAGTTRSRDFPVSSGSHCVEPRGGRDVFLTRLGPQGERLLFSTRLGGSDDDECRALAVDEEGASYLTGRTASHDFPTTLGALDRERCGIDAFVAKFSAGGRTLLYSTFLGGSGQDEGNSIAVDREHRAVVVGWTQSLDFPFDRGTAAGRKDGLAVQIAPMGNVLSWATPIGGGSADEALGVSLDPHGSVWVVGRTRSSDFSVSRDAHQGHLAGASDAFLVRLSVADGKPLYATFLGGEGEDELRSVRTDRLGESLLLGGFSDGIPQDMRGALAGRRRGPADAFVLRFDPRSGGPSTPSGALRAGLELGF